VVVLFFSATLRPTTSKPVTVRELSRVYSYTRATCCLKQHVARNKQLVAGNKQLVARNMLLVARNKLLVRAICCRASCCAGVNAALGFADGFLWPVDFDGRADSESAFLLISSCCCVVLCSNHVFGMVDHKHVGVLKLLDLSAAYDTLDQNDHSTLTGCPHEMFDIIDSALG